jgi:DNA-binding MarR family transcriptional regulator
MAQYVALGRQPGITGATLARACLVTPQAMMVVLKSLEEQGLIVRSPHPRHPNVLELHITDAGCEVLDAARHRVEPWNGALQALSRPKNSKPWAPCSRGGPRRSMATELEGGPDGYRASPLAGDLA